MALQSFNIAPGTSAEDLAARRQIAEQLLLAGSSGAPIQSWTQGLNRVVQSLVGGHDLYEARQQDAAERAQARSLIAEALGGDAASGAPYSPPAAATAAPSQPSAVASALTPRASPAARGIIDNIINAESGGRVNATNPNSSAAGPGQFIDSTWLEQIKRARPDIAAGKTDAQLLALKNDPALAREMTGAYAAQNNAQLGRAGISITPGATYLAHFLGAQGAERVLTADPSTPVEQLIGSAAISANPFLSGMTAADLKAWADRKMGGGAAQAAPAASPQPGVNAVAAALLGNRYTAPLGNALVKSVLTQRFTPPKYGLNPIYGTDAQGNPTLVLPTSRGQVVQPQLPQGFRVTPPGLKVVNAGTKQYVLGRGGDVKGVIQNELAEAEAQKAAGEIQGKNAATQPQATQTLGTGVQNLDELIAKVDQLKTASGLEAATGLSSYFPSLRESTRDFEAQMDSLKSKIALSTLQAMRDASKTGGALGNVSDADIRLLRDSIAGLDLKQGMDSFKTALDTIREHAVQLKERMLRAYQETYGVQPPLAPSTQPQGNSGALDAMKQKYGLQ